MAFSKNTASFSNLPIRFCNLKPKFLLVATLLVTARCVWLWQPERQVLLHQRHFLTAVEDRKWAKVGFFMDNGFHDQFGHDKAWILKESQEIFRQFFVLTIQDRDTAVKFDRNRAHVSTLLRIDGTGTPVAQYLQQTVNAENSKPFQFEWRHASWLPWDWKLTAIDHPVLEQLNEAHSESQ